MSRIRRFLLALTLVVSTTVVGVVATALPAAADAGQFGAPQVTLNPGGGVLGDGSDGIRFTVNNFDTPRAATLGQDSISYRNTQQYYHSGAGAPMLNVGGALFGQAGPAYTTSLGLDWTSLTVLSTGGSTASGALTLATGNAAAKLRYIATKNNLTYQMDRTITYTYPNDYITETFDVTIPTGNAEVVKFYQGGDAAPGNSDQGIGVMLTTPVRSVISLNPVSQIQFGFREVPSGRPFDGATAQTYITPYDTVRSGGDIGFVATGGPAVHDAGLMVQWNLGSTPGVQSGTMQEFVNKQGTNLTAGFDRIFTTAGVPVNLDISIVNTFLATVSDFGLSIALPTGTVIASGATSNSCGGALIATEGGTSVTLSGGAVAAATNCVARVPVVATTYGTYAMSAANVGNLTKLTNNVGSSAFFVPLSPNWVETDLGALTVGVVSTASATSEGVPEPTYAITDGSLPAGLTLNPDTGAITGTPTTGGAYSVTVTATNSGGSAAQTFAGSVSPGLVALAGDASPSNPRYGDPVTLTVSGLPVAAGGTVAFSTGSTALCTVTLPTASCVAPSTLMPGSYPVDAAYSGDTNWEPRTARVASFEMGLAASSVSGSLSAATTTFGSSVSITASVLASAATGSVTASSGDTLCTITLPQTSCNTPSNLAPGSYPVVLTYSGDGLYQPSSSGIGTLTVNRVIPSPTPDGTYFAVYNHPTTFTLPGLPPTATGTVTFTVGGVVLCSYPLGAVPEECVALAGLPAATYDLVIDYSGDVNFAPTHNTATLQVRPDSTAIVSEATISAVYGTSATVTVDTIPTDATGTVTVSAGTTELCTFNAANQISCDVPAGLPAGVHNLLVSYGGDSNYVGSSSVTELTVERAPSAIESPPSVTTNFHIRVYIDVIDIPADATGTVTIVGGPQGTLCSFDAAIESRCATDGLTPPGVWPLTITYPGDTNYVGSTSTSTTLTVDKAVTEIVTLETLSGTYGSPITVAVQGIPGDTDGTVTVSYDRPAGPGDLCSFSALSQTSCPLPLDLPAGEYAVTVSFSGDANYAASSSTLSVTISPAATVISTEPTFSTGYGTPAVINVVGLPKDATGEVRVIGGTPPLGRRAVGAPSGPLLCSFDAAGTDRCQTAADLPAGTYPAYAWYLGDNNYIGSIATTVLTVTQGSAGVDADSTFTGTYGAPTEFSVSGILEGATGTVTVTVGGTLTCTFDVTTATSCSGAGDLPAGTYQVGITYSGDANFTASTKEAELTVNPADSVVGGAAAVGVAHGTGPVFDVTGLPANATGTVTVLSGSLVLCTIEVPGATSCTGPGTLAGGTYPVSISYAGDVNYLPSTFAATLTVAPEAITPQIEGPLGTIAGTPSLFTIAGLPADATGTVSVLSGSLVLCTITLPARSCEIGSGLAPGSYDVVVRYSGDMNYAPYSTTTALIVGSVPLTPAPASGELVNTGVNALGWGWTGLLLLLLGSTLLIAARRRHPGVGEPPE